MKKILASLFGLLVFCHSVFGASATFTGNSTMSMDKNPERGFYISLAAGEGCAGWLPDYLGSSNAYGHPFALFLLHWNPSSGTTQLNTDLGCLRTAGVKALILPEYCASQFCNEGYTISQVEAHIAAAASTFAANADVIAGVQMGVIGAWGETYDSGAGLDTGANRIRVRDALLNALPKSISLHMHSPATALYWYGSALTQAQAFNGTAKSRIGVANYCFMSSSNDRYNFPGNVTLVDIPLGTTEAQQRAFAAAQTEYTPFVFETCSGDPGIRTACTGGTDGAGNSGGILNEGPRYHVTSGNRSFYTEFHDAWIAGGCYNDVKNLMGYRIEYRSLSHADSVTKGTTLKVTVKVRNNGWARVMSQRRLAVRLKKTGASDIIGYSTAQLRQCPSQATADCGLQVLVPIPGGATTGAYSVYLEMPDSFSSLANIAAFRAQPANANSGGQTWDATNRWFATGTTVTVN